MLRLMKLGFDMSMNKERVAWAKQTLSKMDKPIQDFINEAVKVYRFYGRDKAGAMFANFAKENGIVTADAIAIATVIKTLAG